MGEYITINIDRTLVNKFYVVRGGRAGEDGIRLGVFHFLCCACNMRPLVAHLEGTLCARYLKLALFLEYVFGVDRGRGTHGIR